MVQETLDGSGSFRKRLKYCSILEYTMRITAIIAVLMLCAAVSAKTQPALTALDTLKPVEEVNTVAAYTPKPVNSSEPKTTATQSTYSAETREKIAETLIKRRIAKTRLLQARRMAIQMNNKDTVDRKISMLIQEDAVNPDLRKRMMEMPAGFKNKLAVIAENGSNTEKMAVRERLLNLVDKKRLARKNKVLTAIKQRSIDKQKVWRLLAERKTAAGILEEIN